MEEEKRQKILEMYGIGVCQYLDTKADNLVWYGCYNIAGDNYETDNFTARRDAENQAIIDYESVEMES